ncbi:histidine kinase [Janibacter sp. YIM B02568]|uniref:MacS family sensor histidine kinase n=1 Tax=Janibacter endophyticus TaxID=2806261 RepID=UPI00194F787D|nr:DUF5931 domain-containing protein [Janibacter endophyticus]MBM6546212.1 histidine kinase [Janibacter endophyticus]
MGDARGSRYAPSPLIDSAAGRGLAIYRLLALVYASVVVWTNRSDLVRPGVAVGVLVGLLVWSVIAPLWPRPTRLAIVLETLVAVTAIMLTNLAYSAEAVAGGVPTLPTNWAASAVMAGALYSGIRGGLLVAVVIALTNIVQAEPESALTYHNIVLLLLLGALVGLAVNLARESQVRLEAALTASERLAERERIGRQVHDGVLQALALIHRRGEEIGGEATALAGLAADQERALRTLITRVEPSLLSAAHPDLGRGYVPFATSPKASTPGGQAEDLAALLARHRSGDVEVVLPARPVVVPAGHAHEIDAAVAAALDNVRQHAGEGARAWVLLDTAGDELVVTVRDNGAGMAPGRLEEAEREGRLGACASIAGRVRDLEGTASWTSRPGGGCTVTLHVPLPEVAGSRP